jgi:hypothetical protein
MIIRSYCDGKKFVQNLAEKHEGKRLSGRPRCGWVDIMIMAVNLTGG